MFILFKQTGYYVLFLSITGQITKNRRPNRSGFRLTGCHRFCSVVIVQAIPRYIYPSNSHMRYQLTSETFYLLLYGTSNMFPPLLRQSVRRSSTSCVPRVCTWSILICSILRNTRRSMIACNHQDASLDHALAWVWGARQRRTTTIDSKPLLKLGYELRFTKNQMK